MIRSEPLRVLAFMPYAAEHNFTVSTLRGLRELGVDPAIVIQNDRRSNYPLDPLADFAERGRLQTLSGRPVDQYGRWIAEAVEAMKPDVLLHAGAFALYRHVPPLRVAFPRTAALDCLFNEVGHTMNHFLFEPAFDGVIVESSAMADYVARNTLKSDPGVHVIESGVALAAEPASRRGLRSQADAPALTIGFIGRMSPEKNPLGFINLAERLDSMLPTGERLRFRMIGDGPQAEEVAAKAASSPLGGRLSYEGYSDDVASFLRQIDVLFVPSLFDGRPVTIMEAAALGTIVIAAPVGGIPEMIKVGANGFLAVSSDVTAHADILSRLVNSPADLEALQVSARLHAEAHFDAQAMLRRYRDVLVGAARARAA